jgi:hypothetical protein
MSEAVIAMRSTLLAARRQKEEQHTCRRGEQTETRHVHLHVRGAENHNRPQSPRRQLRITPANVTSFGIIARRRH